MQVFEIKPDAQACTSSIIGASIEVHSQLGCGFLESVYQHALSLEIPVYYKGLNLQAPFRCDFLCYNSIIVELKAVTKIQEEHVAQVVNYLKATGMKMGLILNFGHHPRLEIRRVLH
ncbi:MAG: GxxExxY protein [Oligosphaeraceae bacterium]